MKDFYQARREFKNFMNGDAQERPLPLPEQKDSVELTENTEETLLPGK
jgi:Sec-independent protein translocase protein TatA